MSLDLNIGGLVVEPYEYRDTDFRLASDVDRVLSTTERKILANVLFFDSENVGDAYFQGDYSADTNLAVQLQYVSTADIKAYVTQYNEDNGKGTTGDITVDQVKDVFTEARKLSKENTIFNDKSGNIASTTQVETALGTVPLAFSTIQSYVTAYDKEDGQGLNNVTKNDLDRFAKFYGLDKNQKNALMSAYTINNNRAIPKTTPAAS